MASFLFFTNKILCKRKIILLIILLMDITHSFSQVITTDPLDSIYPYFSVRGQADSASFMIKENHNYLFTIDNIYRIRNGYIIEAETKIDSIVVLCYIVSPKINSNHSAPMQIKQTYELQLNRYFFTPSQVSTESVDVSDILLGNRTLSINKDGYYCYLFSCRNIIGSYIKDRQTVESEKNLFVNDSMQLTSTIKDFIAMVSSSYSQDELYSMIDTLAVKKTISAYGIYIQGRSPSDFLLNYHKMKKKKWFFFNSPSYYYSKKELKRQSTYQIFSSMLKRDYDLPLQDSVNNNKIFLIDIKLLYYLNNVYTIQARWCNSEINKRYVIILNLKKQGNNFMIVGFNKSFDGYRNYVPNHNLEFVPISY